MPSKPAIIKALKAKYGFAVGSGKRTSIRRALSVETNGIRIAADLFLAEYANITGASKPGTNLLYELVDGLVIAFNALPCLIMPPI